MKLRFYLSTVSMLVSAAAQAAIFDVRNVAADGAQSRTPAQAEPEFETAKDSDGDGLIDAVELLIGTDPHDADTDEDGLGDGDEVTRGTDPLDVDTDDDGLTDSQEVLLEQSGCPDPLVADSDGDGLSDGLEWSWSLGACDADSDDDGIVDGAEVDLAQGGSCPDPLQADSDGDTLSDGAEAALMTDPCDADTDGDGVPDPLDDAPATPGASMGFIEDGLWSLSGYVATLPLIDFDAPNDNVRTGHRGAMVNQLASAAAEVAAGNFELALDPLESLLLKLDGDPTPPDWMLDGPEKTQVYNEIEMLAYLISLHL